MKQKHLLSGSSLLLTVLILHCYRASPGISSLVVIAHEDRKLGRDDRPCSAHFWCMCPAFGSLSLLETPSWYPIHPSSQKEGEVLPERNQP